MLKELIKKIPPISGLIAERDAMIRANGMAPPGHFYSPVVSIAEATQDQARIFPEIPRTLPYIDMNESGQLGNLEIFEAMYPSIDFPITKTDGHRYYYENPAYLYSDAIMLNCMMRHVRPNRIIEVGSGFSSCAMLDTNDRFLDGKVSLTFIEPYPKVLTTQVLPEDLAQHELIQKRVQDVPKEKFQELEAGDFLFIDSTHVSKAGSDVNFLLFEVLPLLNSGVYIHIHDIFYPFEYPKEWVLGGRSWNEIYALRAFLQFNDAFSIEMMNTFLEHFHESRFAQRMPLCLRNRGGSIWLRKR